MIRSDAPEERASSFTAKELGIHAQETMKAEHQRREYTLMRFVRVVHLCDSGKVHASGWSMLGNVLLRETVERDQAINVVQNALMCTIQTAVAVTPEEPDERQVDSSDEESWPVTLLLASSLSQRL